MDKKPFRIASLGDFQWSPTDNRLAYWTAGDGNVPVRLVLVELNANKLDEVRSKVRKQSLSTRLRLSPPFARPCSTSSIANYVGKHAVTIC